jgi:hypothetical protein
MKYYRRRLKTRKGGTDYDSSSSLLPSSESSSMTISGGGKKKPEKCIFKHARLSTQPNTDPNYKEKGIIHVTDTGAINVIRNSFTMLSNIFGFRGFEESIIDELRNRSMLDMFHLLEENQKVCQIRSEISMPNPNFIVHSLYGTLLES